MKKVGLLLCIVGTCGYVSGQNEEDIFRYSFQKLNGTPRSLGMAGAMSNVGADLSAINTNPAGLGFYRNNAYLIGLGFGFWNTNSFYIGTEKSTLQNNFYIPNLGVSFTNINKSRGKEVEKGLVSSTLAFSLNRRNDFNQKISFQGKNASSSILDHFAERGFGYDATSLGSDQYSIPGLAWNTYLINEDNNTPDNDYVANLPDSITMLQRNEINHSGRQQDISAAFAVNISHRLYIGATFSLSSIRYEQESVWQEENTNFFADTRYMTYTNSFTTQGSGFSLNIGAIVRITDYLRAGLSYQSGTNYALTDNFSREMSSSNFDPGQNHSFNSGLSRFNYGLKTPSKIGGGFSIILGKSGLISVEAESVDYSKGRLTSNDYSYTEANKVVNDNFTNAYNLKIGGEAVTGPFRVRAGFARYGSPLSRDLDKGFNLATHYFTGGLGYRNSAGLFVDLAGVYERGKSFYTPYTLSYSQRTAYTAVNTSSVFRLTVSVGASF